MKPNNLPQKKPSLFQTVGVKTSTYKPSPSSALVPASTSQPIIPRKKKIIVGLPGSSFSSKFLLSWTQTLFTVWQQGRWDITVCPGESSFVSFARLKTLGCDVMRGEHQKPFNDMEYDVFVTIDSDIVFTVEQFVRLIEDTDQHSVVAGSYLMSDQRHLAVVKDWDHQFFVQHGFFQFLTPSDVEKWREENRVRFMPCSYIGMGFFAIRKEALNALKYPYFHRKLERIELPDGKILTDMSSEDVAFCKNLQKAGFTVYLDTELRVGHEKKIVL